MRGSILARVATRTGAAFWRNRTSWLLAAVAIAGLGVYQIGFAGPTAMPTAANGADCADTAMAAVAVVDDEAARAAYQCLGEEMRRSGEQQFVQTLHDRGDLPKGVVSRVGDKGTPDGGRIVFYTIEAAGQSVGYIVYLNNAGLVQKIE
jgi:hypothetical protein